MGRLFPILFLANVALILIALISCLSAEESDIRALPRFAWVLIILLFSPIGPIVWFVAGKERYSQPRQQHWRPGAGFPENQRPGRAIAPDDDPEFLRGLDTNRDRERLAKWEEDLKRREEELRKQDKKDD